MRTWTRSFLVLMVAVTAACIADSIEDFYPTPTAMSNFHLSTVGVRVERHKLATGEWPRSLAEAFPAKERANSDKVLHDSWGELIVYTPGGRCAELRSKGPDKVLHTGDDLVFYAPGVPCPHPRDPEGRTCCDPPNGNSGQMPAEALITQTMERRMGGVPRQFRVLQFATFPESIKVQRINSGAVRDLAYYIGSFAPPNSYDAGILVKAAMINGRTSLVETPEEWAKLVGPSGWSPKSANQALLACKEVIARVLPPARAPSVPIIYKDSSDLKEGTRVLVPEPDRALLIGRAHAPTVAWNRTMSSWEIDLWAVESFRSARYRCNIGRRDGALVLTTTVTDSLPCTGVFVMC